MKASPIFAAFLFVLAPFAASACSDAASDPTSNTVDARAPGADANGNLLPDAASNTDGGRDGDGGDGGPKRPVVPTVGAISAFTLIASEFTTSSIACTPTDCYFANYTPPANAAMKLVNGAASLSALPTGPRLGGLVTIGSTLYGTHFEFVSAASWPLRVYKLDGAAWTPVGVEQPSRNVFADTLATNGSQLFQTTLAGVSAISAGAGPTDAWTNVGTGLTEEGQAPAFDSRGNLYASSKGNIWKLAAGQSTWTDLGVAGYRPYVAPNDDLWVSMPKALGRLPAGTAVWVPITLPVGADKLTSLVVDGSNTAYFTMGIPQKLYKVLPGATAATDTGLTVSATRLCGKSAIDGNGKLLLACYNGGVDGTPWGLWRSTP